MSASRGVNQLNVKLHLFSMPPHAAFKDVADSQLSAQSFHMERFTLVGEGSVAGDNKTVLNA